MTLAVGLSWWLTRERELLGPISGQFVAASIVRGDAQPEKRYVVTTELNGDAYLTFLYLDHTRVLKLPPDATEQATRLSAGPRRFTVTLADDPPGPQWIGAVAKEEPFNPSALRDELKIAIDNMSTATSFEHLVDRLESALRGRPELSFRGHRFEVAAADPR